MAPARLIAVSRNPPFVVRCSEEGCPEWKPGVALVEVAGGGGVFGTQRIAARSVGADPGRRLEGPPGASGAASGWRRSSPRRRGGAPSGRAKRGNPPRKRGMGAQAIPRLRAQHLRERDRTEATGSLARGNDAGDRVVATLLRENPACGAGPASATLGGSARLGELDRRACHGAATRLFDKVGLQSDRYEHANEDTGGPKQERVRSIELAEFGWQGLRRQSPGNDLVYVGIHTVDMRIRGSGRGSIWIAVSAKALVDVSHSVVRTGDNRLEEFGCFEHRATRSEASLRSERRSPVDSAINEIPQEGLDKAPPEDVARRTFERNALVGDLLAVEVDTSEGRASCEKGPRINFRAAEALVLVIDECLCLGEQRAACVRGVGFAHGLPFSRNGALRTGRQLQRFVRQQVNCLRVLGKDSLRLHQ